MPLPLTDAPQRRPIVPAIPISASVLILLWFVPDLLRSPPVFPFQTIAQIEGAPLAALLTPPTTGALLLLLFAVKRPERLIRVGSAFIGLSAVASLLLFGKPAFVTGPVGCLVAAGALLIGAVIAHRRFGSALLFFLLLGAFPAALLGYALYGILTDAYPAAYLLPLKLPVSVFAALSAAAISIVNVNTD